MSDRVADQIGTLIRRCARRLNRKVSEIVLLLFNHKGVGSLGALAGFAIAIVFTWKFLRPAAGGSRRSQPKRRISSPSTTGDGSGASSGLQDCSPELNSKESDAIEEIDLPVQLDLGQIVRRKLYGCRKVTCQLLGVILEEKTPEQLQKQATVRFSVLQVLQEISKTCDIYLMERVLDDESEERVLAALDGAGVFNNGSLTKDKVLFCSTENGRSSFVRQLEADWHIDANLEVVSQLARFIRNQLHISPLALGQIAPNVFTSTSLEQYFSHL